MRRWGGGRWSTPDRGLGVEVRVTPSVASHSRPSEARGSDPKSLSPLPGGAISWGAGRSSSDARLFDQPACIH